MERLKGLHTNGRLLALLTNIRLGWKFNGSGKHSSLVQRGNNYCRKNVLYYMPSTGFKPSILGL